MLVLDIKKKILKGKALALRKNVLMMIHEANSGHPGGSLSSAEIMSVLYFNELKIH